MRIRQLRATPFRLPARRPILLAGGVLHERCAVLVEIDDGDGFTGLGEISLPLSANRHTACTVAGRALRVAAGLGEAGDVSLGEMVACLPQPGGLVHIGWEMALLDLAARRDRKRLVNFVSSARHTTIPVNAMIDRQSADPAAAAARAAVEEGYDCIKIKIEPRDISGTCAVLEAAREAVGARALVRIDANGGWSETEAIDALQRFRPFDLDYVEQPVDSLEAMSRVRAAVPTVIAADESIDGPQSVDAAARLAAADVVVVKPARIGIRAALATCEAARRHGLGVVITSNLDSSVGIAAALQLAAALPEPLRPCGLATGAAWTIDLSRDPLTPESGFLAVPDGPGLGIELNRAALAQCRID
jgi:o-succinylbenzoate synthase